MANYKFAKISVSAVAVLFIILQVANATEPISYENFLQSLEDAVVSRLADNQKDSTNLQVSKLPQEVLQFMKEELYENRVLKDFPTATKDDLTKILTEDVKSRESYYKKNKKIFKKFLFKVLEEDVKNYPGEDSGIDVMELEFLSLTTMEVVDKAIEETIVEKRAPQVDSWKVLTLKDAFRTVYFYCKYPKEMAPFLTEKMRVAVKEWLDTTATWGKWGFESVDGDKITVDTITEPVKLEL